MVLRFAVIVNCVTTAQSGTRSHTHKENLVMSTDPIITCYEEIDWATWEPDDRATLLFVIRGGEILFIHKKRGLGAGKINGPGGRIEPGETPEQAAIRETEEELLITSPASPKGAPSPFNSPMVTSFTAPSLPPKDSKVSQQKPTKLYPCGAP